MISKLLYKAKYLQYQDAVGSISQGLSDILHTEKYTYSLFLNLTLSILKAYLVLLVP